MQNSRSTIYDVTYSLTGTVVLCEGDFKVGNIYEERSNMDKDRGCIIRKFRVNNREK